MTDERMPPLPEPEARADNYEVVPPGCGTPMHPVGTMRHSGRIPIGYTADQMRAYGAKCAAAERERCARLSLTAAYLLKYWADKGMIPRYDAVIDGLRNGAEELERREGSGNG